MLNLSKASATTTSCRAVVLGLMASLAASAALAGPPFLTDDPEPTETGHWEIYGPLLEAQGQGSRFEGSAGAELNYGPAPDVQITVGLPVAYSHDGAGWRSAPGDLELSVKYRFINDEAAGVQVAVFPGLSLPTATRGMGAGRVTALLPVWAQKDAGPWSVFGGGGYAFNPGPGNRDYWTGGLAVSRQMTNRLLLGAEIDRQGADTAGGRGATSLGLGVIYDLKKPFRILASAGPTFEDDGGETSFHAFLALGIDY